MAEDKDKKKTGSTPDQNKKEKEAPKPAPSTVSSGLSIRHIILSIVVLVLAALAASYAVTQTLDFDGLSSKAIKLWRKTFPPKLKVFTIEELAQYDGSDPDKPIYMAIKGIVYDVSAGKKYYAKGGSYNFFAGKDATRAYITGCFETHLTHDLRGLSDVAIETLSTWTDFYDNHDKYFRVGTVALPEIPADAPIPPPSPKQHRDAFENQSLTRSTASVYPLAAQSGLAPIQIFQDNATEERAENARLSAFVGAIAVGDLVKSTLGPKGMDKILQSVSNQKDVMVTNDGATILKSIALDNAAAKVLVNISKVQDDEVGDGTTSVCVLAAELLREGEKLVNQKVHPQTIIEGYRIASAAALKALEGAAQDNSKDSAQFRKDLINIARTTLSSKVLSQDKDYFAELAVNAVLRLKGSTNLDNIQVIKKSGGKLIDSYLDEGFILDKKIGVNQPKRIEKARILIANTAMDTDKIKIFGARVRVDATGKLAELERAEREKMKAKVEKIKAHGINCFVNRQLIYNWPEQLFADSGITAIEHADFDGVERLALVTGGEIASTFDHPELVKLGYCDLIEEIMIGEDRLIKFSGVAAGEACTIVLRGATGQLLDEAERSLHDALCVLSQTVQEPRTVLGGGCSEMLMAKAVDEVAAVTPGKQAIAVEAFARALRQLPTILADNAGYDSSDLVTKLRASHTSGHSTYGLDMYKGAVADVAELGITESYKLKRQVVLSASEAAEMILRVDDIIRCAPRARNRE